MSLLKFVFVLGVLAVSLRNVRTVPSKDIENIQATLMPLIEQCTAELGFSEDVMKKAMESGTLQSLQACLMGCVNKKIKLINEEGLFDVDKAEELSKKYLSDENDQKKVLEVINTCKAVNERDVTDSDKGCERTEFLFECLEPFKDSFIN